MEMIKKADCVEVVETTSDTVMEIDNQLRIGDTSQQSTSRMKSKTNEIEAEDQGKWR